MKNATTAPAGKLVPLAIPAYPWESVSMDLIICDNFCVPPPPPFCNMASLNTGTLTMQFDAMINQSGRTPNISVNVLLDSGATHCFMPQSLATKLCIPITPSSFNSTGLGNGKDCTVLGECSLSMEIQGVRDTLKCLVLRDFMKGIDLVLGNNWHKSNEAITNWKEESVLIRSGSRFFKLFSITSSAWRTDILNALKQPALTHAQTKRWTKQGARSFVMYVGLDNSILPAHHSAFCGLNAESLPALHLGDDDASDEPDIPIMYAPGVKTLLDLYSDIFGPLPIGLPPARGEGHVISLVEGAKPSFRPNFRMSPAEAAETSSQVKTLLAHGFIEQSSSPYAAPILFVTKKDGSVRMVFDYRALNTITKKNRYPLPRIEDLFDKCAGAKVFTTLDLQQGYHQIRIPDSNQEKTASRTPMGLYHFKVLTFG